GTERLWLRGQRAPEQGFRSRVVIRDHPRDRLVVVEQGAAEPTRGAGPLGDRLHRRPVVDDIAVREPDRVDEPRIGLDREYVVAAAQREVDRALQRFARGVLAGLERERGDALRD